MDININLDPEVDEGECKTDALVAVADRFLSMEVGAWHAIIESFADEVEDAV